MPKTFIYMGFVMGTIFFTGGLVMILRPDIVDLGQNQIIRMGVPGLVMAYGLFRVYRSFIALKDQKDNL